MSSLCLHITSTMLSLQDLRFNTYCGYLLTAAVFIALTGPSLQQQLEPAGGGNPYNGQYYQPFGPRPPFGSGPGYRQPPFGQSPYAGQPPYGAGGPPYGSQPFPGNGQSPTQVGIPAQGQAPPPLPQQPPPPRHGGDGAGIPPPQTGTDVGGYNPDIAAGPSHQCYVCSGQYPDQECELYPEYVERGPGRMDCTRDFCTTHVRYGIKDTLLQEDEYGELTMTKRPLSHEDFEVESIARVCEDVDRGNDCKLDGDGMSFTCYTTCTEELCNVKVPAPSAEDMSNESFAPTKPTPTTKRQNELRTRKTVPPTRKNIVTKDSESTRQVSGRASPRTPVTRRPASPKNRPGPNEGKGPGTRGPKPGTKESQTSGATLNQALISSIVLSMVVRTLI